MKRCAFSSVVRLLCAFVLLQAAYDVACAASLQSSNSWIRTLDTPRTFPGISTRSQWEHRAREIREQILVSCGLWPPPKRAPLHPVIFGKIDRDGYSIEKVYFETLPGFYLAGNLYRPLGHGKGPFPAILNPHGHWQNGRLADTADGSIAARCISFARQGMIAFSYDMVGYNDTHFAAPPGTKAQYDKHRSFDDYGTNRTDQLWNIGLMGLQTWDSIRALDFLESLPDADKKRLGCTGESGGGTQTFILGAIDDRLAVQAPVVMVSHTMQGGCSCENAPGLRIEYSNMEIAAAAAPRPQIMVAASGDWTKDMMTVEGPAVAGIYKLFQAEDNLRYVRFNFGHNYNQTSREAVYGWFEKILLHKTEQASCKEEPYQKEPDEALRVFPDGKLPSGAISQEQMVAYLKNSQFERWKALIPDSSSSLKRYEETMLPGWRHTLQVASLQMTPAVYSENPKTSASFTSLMVRIPGPGGITNEAKAYVPATFHSADDPRIAILAYGPGTPTDEDMITPLLRKGIAVLLVRPIQLPTPPDPYSIFFTGYNRTHCQEQVRELVTFCSAIRLNISGVFGPQTDRQKARVFLIGTGRAGLWALLAAPAADGVIADCNGLDVADNEAMLAPDLFCPGIRSLGAFEGVAMIAAPHPVTLHNVGEQFPYERVRGVYKSVGASKKFHVETSRMTPEHIALLASQM